MNFTIQEILKHIKTKKAKDENLILKELEDLNTYLCAMILKVNS
jgi:hypothetical protein